MEDDVTTKRIIHGVFGGIIAVSYTHLIKKLEKEYAFQFWEKVDATHTAMRFVTSWATPEAVIDEFITYLKQI